LIHLNAAGGDGFDIGFTTEHGQAQQFVVRRSD
jgi:hypothetical protein